MKSSRKQDGARANGVKFDDICTCRIGFVVCHGKDVAIEANFHKLIDVLGANTHKKREQIKRYLFEFVLYHNKR